MWGNSNSNQQIVEEVETAEVELIQPNSLNVQIIDSLIVE